MTPFERALAQTLGFEGGASSSEHDTAGRGLPKGSVHTYKGITQRLYDAWRKKHGLSLRHVLEIEDVEIVTIAREEFWAPCCCDELPPEVAIAVFDMAFHSGSRDASRALQEALRVDVDGRIGQQTLAAARLAGPDLLLEFLIRRGAEMQEIIIHDYSQAQNLEGWIARLLRQAYRRSP